MAAEPPAGMSFSSSSLELSSASASISSSRSRTLLKKAVLDSRSTSPSRYVKAMYRQFCFRCKKRSASSSSSCSTFRRVSSGMNEDFST
jgi:hypothetical protein